MNLRINRSPVQETRTHLINKVVYLVLIFIFYPQHSIRDIDQHGIAHCMERLLDMINPYGTRSLHVSFDIDSLDESIAPSTGTPVPGGLSYREAMYISEEVSIYDVIIT